MSNREASSALVDNLLLLMIGGGMLAAALVAPNSLQIFNKPVRKYLKTLDKRARQREINRLLAYMKHRDLIADDYKHGLIVTKKGLRRIEKRDFDNLSISRPERWDGKWRLVLFDIPEKYKSGRDALSSKLRSLGFKPLQKSAWIHPFPCKDELALVCQTYGIDRYVSYLEITNIDNEKALKKKFSTLL